MTETVPPQALNPEANKQPEITDAERVHAAIEAIENGQATDEQKALVAGFEAGAQAHAEMTSEKTAVKTPEERVISGDLLDAVNTRIDINQAAIDADKGWGIDTSKQQEELQADKDMKAYLEQRPAAPSDKSEEKIGPSLPPQPQPVEVEQQLDQATVSESLAQLEELPAADQSQPTFEQPNEVKPSSKSVEQAEKTEQPSNPEQWENQYKDLSMEELLSEWAEAEDYGDKTKAMDIQDVIQDKLINVSSITEEHKLNLIDTAHNEMMKRRKNAEKPEDSSEAKSSETEISPEGELSFTAARSTDILKEIDRLAKELNDRDRNAWKDRKGLGKIIGLVGSILKHNTVVDLEMQRRIGGRIYEALSEKAKAEGREISVEDLDEFIRSEGLSPITGTERAMLEGVAEGLFGPEDMLGRKISGEGQNESPEVVELRAGIKQRVLDFVSAYATEGLTDEQRQKLLDGYNSDLANYTNEFMSGNELFSQETITMYADNARELLTRSIAISRHEDGMAELDRQLEAMRIDIGEIQTGAHNNADVEYLRRTVELQRARNIASVLGKSTFVASTWVAAATLSSGLATWATQNASSKGVTIAGTAVGAALGGPFGAAIGLAATTGMAAAWSRHMARRTQSRNEDLRAVNQAYGIEPGTPEGGASPEHLESFVGATELLKEFMILPEGIDPATATDRDLVLRTDLSNDEQQALASALAHIQARLDTEAAYNINASEVASEQQSRDRGLVGAFRSVFRSQSAPSGRGFSLFNSTDRASYVSERNDLLRAVTKVADGFSESYSDSEITINVTGGDGEEETRSIKLSEYLASELVSEQQTASHDLDSLQDDTRRRINQAGRRGAIIGGGAALAFGVGTAAVRELTSQGTAQTIFDAFGGRKDPEIVSVLASKATFKQSGANSLLVEGPGKSGGKIVGDQITVTTPKGETLTANLRPNGTLSSEDIKRFADAGAAVNIDKTARSVVDTSDYIRQIGGKKSTGTDLWLANDTSRYDGTELSVYRNVKPNGDIIWTHGQGVARQGGVSVDVLEAAKQGRLSLRLTDGNSEIRIPYEVSPDGSMKLKIPNDSPIRNLFTKSGAYKGDLLQTVVEDPRQGTMSVNAMPGLHKGAISVAGGSDIEVIFPEQTIVTPGSPAPIGSTLVGAVPTMAEYQGFGQRIEEESEESEEDEEPTPDEPTNESPIEEIIEQTPERPEAVQAEPLPADEIVRRLQSPEVEGARISINGQTSEISSVEDNGNLILISTSNGQESSISANELESDINQGVVRIDRFLGSNNAESIVNDLQDAEIFYDRELGSYVRIYRSGNNFRYVELDEDGSEQLREPDSNPRSYLRSSLIWRISNGIIVPVQKRGVQQLPDQLAA